MRIKFCPKCRGEEIGMIAGGLIGLWECKKCGFSGTIFPEKEVKERKRKKK